MQVREVRRAAAAVRDEAATQLADVRRATAVPPRPAVATMLQGVWIRVGVHRG